MNALPAITPAQAQLPRTYEAARAALAECQNIDECKDWADKAAALASYAKQAEDETLMKMAARIKARATRRAGELLAQIQPAHGANQNIREGDRPKVNTRSDAAAEAGMSPHQQKQAQRIAAVPDADFEAQVESDTPPTLTQLAQQGIKPKPRPVLDLNGRDPRDFNRALHFLGTFENYAREVEAATVDAVLPILTDGERARLRGFINRIDAIHDRIMTRV
jgi:hypothetical protein